MIEFGRLKNEKTKMQLIEDARKMGFTDEEISEIIAKCEKNEEDKE